MVCGEGVNRDTLLAFCKRNNEMYDISQENKHQPEHYAFHIMHLITKCINFAVLFIKNGSKYREGIANCKIINRQVVK